MRPTVIDSLAFHDWKSDLDLVSHLDDGFKAWVERPGDLAGPRRVRAAWMHEHPAPAVAASPYDPDEMLAVLFGGNRRERAVLGYHDGLLATGYPNRHGARALVGAANDWTRAAWLERDERLGGLILVSTASPDDAVAEIERLASDPRWVGISLGLNTLGRLFGDPLYHPVYRAAAEADLPIVLQVECDSATDQAAPALAGGPPTTFAEVRALAAQSFMSHVGSLITESVFDLFPDLRFVLSGGGATWIPAYLWRLDYWYKVTPGEAPWLVAPPSDYFLRHFWVTTHGIENFAREGGLAQALLSMPELGDRLIYAGGLPNDNAEDPDAVLARLPEDWRAAVARDNAARVFRWADRSPAAKAISDREALLGRRERS